MNNNIPRHVGIVMDGNGRWARKRGMPRFRGHAEGLKSAKEAVLFASEAGISFLSLYIFSTENWKRSEEEISFLMQLIKKHLRNEYQFYKENGIRVWHSGFLERLPKSIQKEIADVKAETANFTGLTVNLLINYGGHNEIIRGVNRRISKRSTPDITEEELESFLDHSGDLPPMDLMIRTGGEKRISNFLLWQSAYSEFFFSDKLWPDWKNDDFCVALSEYKERNRRHGSA